MTMLPHDEQVTAVFTDLFDRLVRHARRWGSTIQDAEDIAQDALLAAWRQGDPAKINAAFLTTVLKHLLWRRAGRAARRPKVEPLEHDVPREHGFGSPMDARDLLRAAETTVDDPENWRALQLAAEDLPAAVIAHRLGLATANAVNLRVSRSRRKLARIETQLREGTGRGHYAAGLAAFAVEHDGTETPLSAMPSRLYLDQDGCLSGTVRLEVDADRFAFGCVHLASDDDRDLVPSLPFPLAWQQSDAGTPRLALRAFLGTGQAAGLDPDGVECPPENARLFLFADC